MPTVIDYNQLSFDSPVPTTDYINLPGVYVKTAIETAEITVEIAHNLGYQPKAVELVFSDNPFTFAVEAMDEQSVIITPFESFTTIVLRIS